MNLATIGFARTKNLELQGPNFQSLPIKLKLSGNTTWSTTLTNYFRFKLYQSTFNFLKHATIDFVKTQPIKLKLSGNTWSAALSKLVTGELAPTHLWSLPAVDVKLMSKLLKSRAWLWFSVAADVLGRTGSSSLSPRPVICGPSTPRTSATILSSLLSSEPPAPVLWDSSSFFLVARFRLSQTFCKKTGEPNCLKITSWYGNRSWLLQSLSKSCASEAMKTFWNLTSWRYPLFIS